MTEQIEYEDYKATLQDRLDQLEEKLEALVNSVDEEYTLKHEQLNAEKREKLKQVKKDIEQERRDIQSEMRGFDIADNVNKGRIDELAEENETLKSEATTQKEEFAELYKSMLEQLPPDDREGFNLLACDIGLIDPEPEEPEKEEHTELAQSA